ncbi:hypothetical protein [Maribacter flavus]|uniref:Uncharacterized protein n=2 Tax=Maribacter TaxID=252356 RepID=A0A5B2TXX5_9FLAO|nr:hypothetical protein [Maribacter flavus]KAA2219013.1 hypothetical protein F0361_05210 [Maribacter flavus]
MMRKKKLNRMSMLLRRQKQNSQTRPNYNRIYDFSDVMVYSANRAFERVKKWIIQYAVYILGALIALTVFALIMMFWWMV